MWHFISFSLLYVTTRTVFAICQLIVNSEIRIVSSYSVYLSGQKPMYEYTYQYITITRTAI